MKPLSRLREQFAAGEFEFSRHALRRAVERNISDAEIRAAGAAAVIIEDYPADKYSHSCLLLGFSAGMRPLHLQVSRAPDRPLVRIITLYEPDPAEWVDYRVRRK
ncbi:MAG: DUF4258 domain-containing protein [Rhodocyclaceae bacterium]|jgi:hypothetical protein|nr:MAG: DUF4258 domain-containing protein [Rhodocyclaceae bacterium]HNB46626.1 DUF4258 domain-containing protein [Burkholderiaceae bacterium]